MKQYTINHIIYKIGSNANENWNLLENSKPYHLFFHLSSFPSCYTILECDITVPEIDIIKEVAQQCKNHTKYKNIPNIKVDYTLCENVIKGEKIGEVFFKSNKKVKQIKI